TDPTVCGEIGRYVALRHRALRTSRDRSRDVAGDQPVWEVAAAILTRALGHRASALQPWLVDPLVRRLLAVPRPSVVDGRMGRANWFPASGATLVKTEASAGAFSNLDLCC